MSNTKNLANAITETIKAHGGSMTAKDIYTQFSTNYTKGQIAGELYRLKQVKRLTSPHRGVYQNTNHTNVLNQLKTDLADVATQYNKSVPITIFSALSPSEQKEYTDLITRSMNLI